MKKTLIRGLFFGVLAVAAAGTLMGCGGGSDNGGGGAKDTTVSTSSHSKAEFIKLANTICKKGKETTVGKLGPYLKSHGGETKVTPKSERIFAEALQVVFLPAVQTQIEEIRALGAPAGDEQKIEAFLSALQEATDAHREGAVRSQEVFTKDFKRSARLAQEYGLEYCAYEG
jgi:hypothetical protein